MSLNPTDRRSLRNWILAQIDIDHTVIELAIGGTIDTQDLWWLYDEHRIMSDGSAWLLALMHEGILDDDELEKLDPPSFWTWYDHGRLGTDRERFR